MAGNALVVHEQIRIPTANKLKGPNQMMEAICANGMHCHCIGQNDCKPSTQETLVSLPQWQLELYCEEL